MDIKIDKSNWKKVRLGDVATEYSKRVNNPSESGLERFVGNSNIGQWDFRVKDWDSTSSVTSAMKLFEPNDYLLVRRSLYASDFRERAPRAHFSGVCSGDILTIRENPEFISDGFLVGILNSPALWKFVVANASGSITRRIKWKDLANYEFYLPPLDKQKELSKLFWSLESIITTSEQSDVKSRRLYEAIRELECFGLVANEELKYNSTLKSEVNSRIEFKKLESYLSDVKYGTSKKGNNSELGVKVIGIPNVIKERLTVDSYGHVELEDKELNNCLLKKGDIVIVRTNGNPSYTGRSAMFDIDEQFVYASYLIKISVDEQEYDPEYLVRYLQTNLIRRYFRRNATSTAGNYNINTEVIKRVPIPVLSIAEQKRIVIKLKAVEKQNESVTDHLNKSIALKKTLINQVL